MVGEQLCEELKVLCKTVSVKSNEQQVNGELLTERVSCRVRMNFRLLF